MKLGRDYLGHTDEFHRNKTNLMYDEMGLVTNKTL